jgi:hypothetical protein
MADIAFRALADRPRYAHDGVEQMRAHVQQWTGRTRHHVTERDFVVFGHPVRTVTSRQWALLEEIRAAVPDAHMALHLRELIWRRDPAYRAPFCALRAIKRGSISTGSSRASRGSDRAARGSRP